MLASHLKWFLPDPRKSKTVLTLAAPVMAAMLTQTFINQLDTILVGRLPEDISVAGQAALGYSILLHWMVGGFVSAISVGTQAIAARRFGENDKLGAGHVMFNSAMLALFAGTVVTLLAATFTEPLFRLFTSNEDVLRQGIPYCRTRFFGILAMVGTMSFKSFFDGLGKTHYHLIAALVMNVVNAILAYTLVFGVFGLPRLEVLGAGIAATAASYVGLFMMMSFAFRRNYRVEFGVFRARNFKWATMGRIGLLSLPSGIATVVVMTGFLLFFKWVGMLDSINDDHAIGSLGHSIARFSESIDKIGISAREAELIRNTHHPVYEAATKVIIDIFFLAIMTCMGLGIATATLVSQNLGRKLPDVAESFGWTAVRLAAMFAGLMGLIAMIAPDFLLGIFTKEDVVIAVGRMPLRIIGAGEFMVGFALVLAQALFGAGATRYVMMVEIILHFGLLVPLSYVLAIPFGLKLNGIFLAALLYVLSLAIAMTWKFKAGSWKKIKI